MSDYVLPKGVYFKNGAYHLVRNNQWVRIGREFSEPSYLAASMKIKFGKGIADRKEIFSLTAFLEDKVKRQRASAKQRGIEWEIDLSYVISLGTAQGWLCALTGLRFSLHNPDGALMLPFAPSIDRIDSSLGYVDGNCQLVNVTANLGKGSQSCDVFRQAVGINLRQRTKRLDHLQKKDSKTSG